MWAENNADRGATVHFLLAAATPNFDRDVTDRLADESAAGEYADTSALPIDVAMPFTTVPRA